MLLLMSCVSCNLLQKINYFIYILYLVFVSVKQPTVTVDNDVARLNDVATLTCTIGILDDNPELVEPSVSWTPDNGDMSLGSLMDTTFLSTYNVAVSSTSLAGDYTCSVTIAANNGNTRILQSSGSSIGTVYVTGTSIHYVLTLPYSISSSLTDLSQCFNFLTHVSCFHDLFPFCSIVLSLTASAEIRLDVSPYNDFTTECVLSYFPESAAGVTVTFSLTSDNGMSNISDGLVSNDSNSQTEMHTVTITGADNNSTEQHKYSCKTNTTIANASSVIDEESVMITVRGNYSRGHLLINHDLIDSYVIKFNGY